METVETVRVAIIDDDEVLRDNLRLLIDTSPGFSCPVAYADLDDALEKIDGNTTDVLLLDIDMPGTPGPEGIEDLKRRCPRAEVVMFTVYAEEDKVFESLCNGASGYLLKHISPPRLLEAIRDAHSGGAPMSSEIARKVIRLFRQVAPPPQGEHDLTSREVGLLRLLAEGYSYQGAADKLFVTINTVRSHVRSIYDKLHVHSRSQAVHAALRQGIL